MDISSSDLEVKYENISFPIIENDGLLFTVIPSGFILYKIMPKDIGELHQYYQTDKYPFPDFYIDYKKTEKELQKYPNTHKIYKYRTVRPLKLFILNEGENIVELAYLFSDTAGISGFLEPTRKEAIKELISIIGVKSLNKQTKKRLQEEMDLEERDYHLTPTNTNSLNLTYAIYLKFSRNLCIVLNRFGNDGYITKLTNRLTFCVTKNVLEPVT